MSSSTVWLMDDEAEVFEIREAYAEARAEVDRRVPRGDAQWRWIVGHGGAWFARWCAAHDVASRMDHEFEEDN